MASNYVGPKSPITIPAPAAVIAGQAILVGTIVGICGAAAGSGDQLALEVEGQFTVPKVSAQVWTAGAKLYWDDTAKLFTTVSTSNTLCGFAGLAAANPSSTGLVCLTGQVA